MTLSLSVRSHLGDPDVAPRSGESIPAEEEQPSPIDSTEVAIDLRPLKAVAKNLPESDPVRRLIAGEPDFLPTSVLAAKADSWVVLLLPREG